MNPNVAAVARACNEGTENNTLSFPAQLGRLAEAGIEGYYVDFRQGVRIFHLPDGSALELPAHKVDANIAAAFTPAGVEAAVRRAQAGGADYTYQGFCLEAMASGCAGYVVSLPGRRVVYFGRTAETHVEHFPPAP
ncbi:MAG TPA: DUF1398 family protein [Burkholderiales bacterium]|jgi:uncharacterized protein YbcV (DUF1398 family)